MSATASAPRPPQPPQPPQPPPPPPPPPPSTKFLSGLSALVLLQAASRVLTFLLNQALVRLASPAVFGTAAIQFELLISSILFLCREGVRLALLRTPEPSKRATTPSQKLEVTNPIPAKGKKPAKAAKAPKPVGDAAPEQDQPLILTVADDYRLASNISTLPFLAGIPIALTFALLYYKQANDETSSQPNFLPAVAIYVLAALIELAAEPLYIRAQVELHFRLRVTSEGTGVILRTLTTVALLLGAPTQWNLLAFALGQLAYALSVFFVYWTAYRSDPGALRLWPATVTRTVKEHTVSRWFDRGLLRLSMSMTMQSLVKHFLTEGDKFVVTQISPLADQGGYAVASNYGSLVARIVFQPIEEISRVYFSKTLAECTVEPQKPKARDALAEHALLNNPQPRLTPSQEKALQAASATLQTLLLFETHLSLLFLTFLPPYLPTLLAHFLPSKYRTTSAPTILQTYAYYLPAMSLNGILEACTYSIMSAHDLKLASRFLFGFSFLFFFSATFLVGPAGLGLGERGLVWANVINLTLRAAYAWSFITSWFAKRGQRALVSARRAVPPVSALATFVFATIASRLSWKYIGDQDIKAQIKHVSVGVACLAVCVAECYRSQRAELHAIYAFVRRR